MADGISTLIEKEDVTIKQADGSDKTYFISSMPAWEAHKIFLQASGMGLFNGDGKIPAVPPALAQDLLKYCGTYNNNGAEVVFKDVATMNMMVRDQFDFIQLEIFMLKKNFSFFFDGRGASFLEQMTLKDQSSEK